MALAAIHQAIYGVLSADTALNALVTGVFNDVPDEQAYPHIQIGSATSRPWHTFGGASVGKGWNTTVTIHIWSRYQGDLEVLTIRDRVVALLDHATIAVAGYPTAIFEVDQERVLVEQINKVETRHAPVVVRVMVH